MYAARAEARNAIRSATSSGRPIRPSGIGASAAARSAMIRCSYSSGGGGGESATRLRSHWPDQMSPTHTVLTRMRASASSFESAFVSAMPAARLTDVGTERARGCFAPMWVTLMIRPPPFCRIAGSAARIARIAPKSFRSRSACQASSPAASNGPIASRPALLTRTSILPKRASVSATKRSGSPGFATSAATQRTSAFVAARTASLAARRTSARRAQIATRAPSAPSRCAVASPMPSLPPVIAATLPSRPRSTLGPPLIELPDSLERLSDERDVLLPELPPLVRVQVRHARPQAGHRRLELGTGDGSLHRPAQHAHRLGRGPFVHDHPDLQVVLEVLPLLLQRRHVRQRLKALLPHHGERAERPRLDVREYRARPGGHHVHVAAQQGGDRGAGAVVGHVLQADAGGRGEHLRRQVDARVVAGRAVGDLPGPAPGV